MYIFFFINKIICSHFSNVTLSLMFLFANMELIGFSTTFVPFPQVNKQNLLNRPMLKCTLIKIYVFNKKIRN